MTDSHGLTRYRQKRNFARARPRPRVVFDGGEVTPDPTDAGALEGARRAALPKSFEPQLATLGDSAPEGDEWLHEMKLDGYRILCRIDGGDVRLLSRNGKDWTDRFAEIAEAAAALPCERALIDGEVVVLDRKGMSHFQSLQQALRRKAGTRDLHWFAFDIVHLDGSDIARAPLTERKELLRALLERLDPDGVIRYCDHVAGNGPEFFRQACRSGLEGIISKRADSPYRSGRGRDWRKTKCTHRQEFVIVGYTEPGGSRTGFGALLLAVNDEDGNLVAAGRVGTGFTNDVLGSLHAKLEKLERATPPIVDPPTGAKARDVHWVKPALIAEVAFTEWTADGSVRHPSFQGLREDKSAEDIVRERARS
jgi:bifunctional non-homologous end joining protein LigD